MSVLFECAGVGMSNWCFSLIVNNKSQERKVGSTYPFMFPFYLTCWLAFVDNSKLYATTLDLSPSHNPCSPPVRMKFPPACRRWIFPAAK